MTKSKIIFSILVGFITLTIVSSCNKDEKLQTTESNLEARTAAFQIPTTGKVQVTNGMLDFSSIQNFTWVLEELYAKNSDSTAFNQAYNHLNIVADGENLVCRNPINLAFENSLGFNSFRKYEENRYFQHLTSNAGDETAFVKESQLWDDPHYQSLFNVNREVKIGSTIFKIYPSGHMLAVANSDWTRFNALKNNSPVDITSQLNVRVLDHEEDKNNYLYGEDLNGNRTGKDIIDLNIGVSESNTGVLSVINRSFVSFVDGSAYSYNWKFPDGTQQAVIQPNKIVLSGEIVKLELIKNGTVVSQTEVEIRSKCDHIIRTKHLGNCNFEITMDGIQWNINPGGSVKFTVLPNGTPITATKTANSAVKTINGLFGTNEILIEYFTEGGALICSQKHTIKCVDCGLEREKDNKQFFPIAGREWKLEVKIWCRSSALASKVGSYSITKRKNNIGIFVTKNVDEIRANFIGKIYNEGDPTCPVQNIPYEESTEFGNHHTEANIPNSTTPKKPVYHPNECKSAHWFRIGQTKFIYTLDGGFLFLD